MIRIHRAKAGDFLEIANLTGGPGGKIGIQSIFPTANMPGDCGQSTPWVTAPERTEK